MRFEVRPFDPSSHREGLVALWKDNLYTAAPGRPQLMDRRFEWLYQQNPEGPAKTWVAQPGDNHVLAGCASLYPRIVSYAGREVLVGTGCDFAVGKEHRVFGPALSLQRSLVGGSLAEGFQFLLVWPDKASIGLFRRVGYTTLGETERWVKVLRPERYAEDINNSKLVVMISRMASKGLEVVDQAFRAPYLRELWGTRTEVLDRPDARFDALWSEARQSYLLCEAKTASYLSWRYCQKPLQPNRFFCLFDKNDSLLGYVVFTVEDNVACVEDLFARDAGRMTECLLVEFIQTMHNEGMTAISVVFLWNEQLAAQLKRLFFLRREQLNPLLVYFDPEAPAQLREGVLSSRDWLLFDGGMDI